MNLNHYLQVVEKALSWRINVPESERASYVNKLVEI